MKHLIFAAALLACLPARAGDLPDAHLTPGDARPGVTAKQLCPVAHTPKLRHVTEATKKKVFAEYGIKHPKPGEYEIDHLISLELGGSNDIKNLWPQSYKTKPWNAHVKDKLENRLHAELCGGSITLDGAQQSIRLNWILSFQHYFGTP